jgi:hypothetical protein
MIFHEQHNNKNDSIVRIRQPNNAYFLLRFERFSLFRNFKKNNNNKLKRESKERRPGVILKSYCPFF